MRQDFLYDTALATATDILHSLGDNLVTAERLAKVTYAILDAMRQAERQRQGLPCPALGIAACYLSGESP
jgi:hypothetical protein